MRAPSGGKAILSDAVSGADDVLGASWRRRRNGGGRSAVTLALSTPFGARDRLDAPSQPLESVEQDRRRRLATDQAGRRAVVRPPDPDRDRGPPVEADRERIAKAVRRAGLEGDPAFERVRGRRRAAQNVRDIIGRDRIGHPARADDRRLTVEPLDERRRLAAAREAGVEPREIGQRNPKAAKTDGEADRRILRQRDLGARAMQPGKESRRADVGQQFDRRKIERHLQRLARRHRALVAEIEILRRVSAVAHRPVEQPRLRMGEALLEGERIDEGLERRARRARRARHVDRAVARGIVGVRPRRREREFHRVALSMTTIAADSLGPRRATLSLARVSSFACRRASIESLMTFACRSAATASSAAWAASAGKASRACGTGSRFAAAASAALMTPRATTRSSTRSRAARAAAGERSGRRASGDCGSATSKRRLGEGQPQRLFAEIGERGGPHALEIAAEGSKREVTIERPRLADLALDLERARDLSKLGDDRALGPRLDQPRDLHRQRRAAGHHMAAHQPLRAGANEGAKVDAVVLIKPPVLIGDEHRDIARIDVMRGRRQSPASIGQGEGP